MRTSHKSLENDASMSKVIMSICRFLGHFEVERIGHSPRVVVK